MKDGEKNEGEARELSDSLGDQNDTHLWTWLGISPSASGLTAAVKQLDKGRRLHYKPLQGITG